MIELYSSIWEEHNLNLHGRTVEESKQKACETIISRVQTIYLNPPHLVSRFPAVTSIPLNQRLKCTTQQLKDWFTRLEHQKKISGFIFTNRTLGQLTIQQTFNNARKKSGGKDKYPP